MPNCGHAALFNRPSEFANSRDSTDLNSRHRYLTRWTVARYVSSKSARLLVAKEVAATAKKGTVGHFRTKAD